MPNYEEVEQFPGYRVGDDGSVWSRWLKGNWKPKRMGLWRRLKEQVAERGYHMVTLYNEDGACKFLVHRLILMVFSGPPPKEGLDCCHRDGDTSNNDLTNLYWGTRQQNMQDAVRHETIARGKRNARAKLTENQVREIRDLWAHSRIGQDALAERFGVSQSAISLVVINKTWTHVS